jgi:integrase/recombinase XerD
MAKYKIILFTSKTLKADTHPVVLRITHDRQRKYYVIKNDNGQNLNFACKPEDWIEEDSRYDKKVKNASVKNAVLSQVEENVKNVLFKMSYEEIKFSFSAFEREYLKKIKKATVVNYFDAHIAKLKEAGRTGYSNIFKYVRNSVSKHLPAEDSRFQEIDYHWLKKYTSSLESEGLKPNAIFVYLRTLRTLFNECIKDGYLFERDYPFKSRTNPNGFSISGYESPTLKRALAKEEFLKVMKYRTEPDSDMFHAKQMFLFSFFAMGINFVDMCHLRWDKNIQNGRIVYSRQKTGGAFTIAITKELDAILMWYKKKYPESKYIFPVICEQKGLTSAQEYSKIKDALKKTNQCLKDIATDLKLKNCILTTYVARHTFASLLYQSGQPMSKIKQSLGHQTEHQTSTYLAGFGLNEIDQMNNELSMSLKRKRKKQI